MSWIHATLRRHWGGTQLQFSLQSPGSLSSLDPAQQSSLAGRRNMADKTQEDGGVHFPFPFLPYSIQKGFMAELYQVLEASKMGTIIVSPWHERMAEKMNTSTTHLCGDFHGMKLGIMVLSDYLWALLTQLLQQIIVLKSFRLSICLQCWLWLFLI